MDSTNDSGIKWGAEIAVDGLRPKWLGDRDIFQWSDGDGFDWWDRMDEPGNSMGMLYNPNAWGTLKAIRLPADHPHYQKQAEAPKVDWSKPIEAVHVDGRVQSAKVEDWDGPSDQTVGVRFNDGGYAHLDCESQAPAGYNGTKGWTIRNVQTTEPETAPAIDPALVERMVALVRKVGASDLGGTLNEAQSILKALEPVNPDEAIVDELMRSDCTTRDAIREAIRRGRQLERERAQAEALS